VKSLKLIVDISDIMEVAPSENQNQEQNLQYTKMKIVPDSSSTQHKVVSKGTRRGIKDYREGL
jgi:hypothetical protein